MLIRTRKLGENIRIGDKIKITVLDVKGGQVKLGIDAPPHIAVHREEIYQKILEENRRASGISPSTLKEVAATLQPRKRKRRGQEGS